MAHEIRLDVVYAGGRVPAHLERVVMNLIAEIEEGAGTDSPYVCVICDTPFIDDLPVCVAVISSRCLRTASASGGICDACHERSDLIERILAAFRQCGLADSSVMGHA
jgi:hypothetical protein